MLFELPFLSGDDLYYGTDSAYRKLIRKITNMDLSKSRLHSEIDYSELDDVTRDEMDYDEDAMMEFMNVVWKYTKQNVDLCELYQYSAGAMFSTDPEVGIVVLFAYDYLPLFYPVLYAFSQNPNIEVDTHPNYNALLNIFRKQN